MALFRRVAVEVAEHLGYEYPHNLDQRVTAYVQNVKRLAHRQKEEQRANS
jgi:aminoglycoside 6-adenylyltransferase